MEPSLPSAIDSLIYEASECTFPATTKYLMRLGCVKAYWLEQKNREAQVRSPITERDPL